MIYRIDFRAMGCRMIAMLDSASPEAPERLSQVPNWFEEWEQVLSRFREDSELNNLNRTAGWPVRVGPVIWEVFQVALAAESASGGLVQAAVLPAMVRAGYDTSFELLPHERLAQPYSDWNLVPSLAEATCEETRRTICLPSDVQLDFGGVAKGWAAMQAVERLATLGPALVSAGGDIAVSDRQTGGGFWPVTVDDPFRPGEIIATLQLGACGVATSGTDYRRWKQGGRWQHHIIDPRTGHPAQTDLTAVTVVAPTAAEAEMAAKTALILGSRAGMQWIAGRPQLAALFVLETGDVLCSDKMEDYFWRSE